MAAAGGAQSTLGWGSGWGRGGEVVVGRAQGEGRGVGTNVGALGGDGERRDKGGWGWIWGRLGDNLGQWGDDTSPYNPPHPLPHCLGGQKGGDTALGVWEGTHR